jgi:hypothetical protein
VSCVSAWWSDKKHKRVAGSGEAPEHGGGACLRVRLNEVYRSSIEKAKFVILHRSKKQPTRSRKVLESSSTTRDNGPGAKNNR